MRKEVVRQINYKPHGKSGVIHLNDRTQKLSISVLNIMPPKIVSKMIYNCSTLMVADTAEWVACEQTSGALPIFQHAYIPAVAS